MFYWSEKTDTTIIKQIMDKKEIQNLLLKEIEKTEKLICEYKEMTKPVAPDNALGRLTRMDAINNKSLTESILRRAEEKLAKLNYVLSQIDSKDFGVCISCGTAIPLARILVKPESSHCVNCAK